MFRRAELHQLNHVTVGQSLRPGSGRMPRKYAGHAPLAVATAFGYEYIALAAATDQGGKVAGVAKSRAGTVLSVGYFEFRS